MMTTVNNVLIKYLSLMLRIVNTQPMKLKLLFFAMTFSFIAQSQTNEDIKHFINKNAEAVTYIYSKCVTEKNTALQEVVRGIVKDQLVSLELYKTNTALAFSKASSLRNICNRLIIENLHQPNSLYELTVTEKQYAVVNSKTTTSVLSESVLNSISTISISKSNSLNNFKLAIQ